MNIIDKLKIIILENCKTITLVIGMTILSVLMLIVKLAESEVELFSKGWWFTFLVFIILTFIACMMLCIAKIKNWKIEKIFLIAGLILGAFYVFIIPPGDLPDELGHFSRAYELSEGRLFTGG